MLICYRGIVDLEFQDHLDPQDPQAQKEFKDLKVILASQETLVSQDGQVLMEPQGPKVWRTLPFWTLENIDMLGIIWQLNTSSADFRAITLGSIFPNRRHLCKWKLVFSKDKQAKE